MEPTRAWSVVDAVRGGAGGGGDHVGGASRSQTGVNTNRTMAVRQHNNDYTGLV